MTVLLALLRSETLLLSLCHWDTMIECDVKSFLTGCCLKSSVSYTLD